MYRMRAFLCVTTTVKLYPIWGTTLITRLFEMSYPELPGVLRIVRGYILTEAYDLQMRAHRTARTNSLAPS